jgi:hypothetical protein
VVFGNIHYKDSAGAIVTKAYDDCRQVAKLGGGSAYQFKEAHTGKEWTVEQRAMVGVCKWKGNPSGYEKKLQGGLPPACSVTSTLANWKWNTNHWLLMGGSWQWRTSCPVCG